MTHSARNTPSAAAARHVPRATLARWGLFVALLLAFILVPFALWEGQMNEFVQRSLRTGPSLATITLAVVLFLLADIVLPVPSSFVLATTGYMLGVVLGTAVGFVGLSCASLAGYALGRYAGGPLAERVVGRAQLERFAALSARHGDWLLVAFRAMPVLAEATTLLAGISRMPLARFCGVVSVGNIVVAFAYAWIGAVSADQSSFLFASVACIVLPVIVVLTMRRAAARQALPATPPVLPPGPSC